MTVFALVKIKDGAEGTIDRNMYEVFEGDNDIWVAEKYTKGLIYCRKPGYGTPCNYNNGSVCIRKGEHLEMLTPWVAKESHILDEYRHYLR